MRTKKLFDKVDGYKASRQAKEAGLYPYFREIVSAQEPEVRLKSGETLVMLGSNSYLGLTTHPEVVEAATAAAREYGTGCAGSRFLNGTLDLHAFLERELAEWVGKEAALVFTTGFQVNLGVLAALLGRHDLVFLDSHDHASIVDGTRLSQARLRRFPHADMAALERLLQSAPADKARFIVTDGVFSMEGDIAPLPELVRLAEHHQAALMVDDAHGLGVLGEEGRGTATHFGLTDKVDFIMGTFSKALASVGGFVAADHQSIEFLKHHARALIFSASMTPPAAAAARAALRIIRREPQRIARLWRNTRHLKSGLDSLGFDTGPSQTPIVPVRLGSIQILAEACKQLQASGVFVNPVIPPAVPPERCILRLSLMATHTEAQIAFALEAFAKVGRRLGII